MQNHIALLCGMMMLAIVSHAQTTFTPAETDEILANPHMGWETFHVPAKYDRSLPDWIPSTVYYARFGWRDLESAPGQLNVEFIEKELNAAQAAGQRLATRVMNHSSNAKEPYHPDWLAQIGGRILENKSPPGEGGPGGKPLLVPDMDDPIILKAHLDFIRRFGEKYDGDPRLDHLDLGSVGWWGEWHMSGDGSVKMPSDETCQAIVDAYVKAFTKTPLIMLIGGGKHTTYAAQQGTGWRADCLGDMGGFSKNWCHMRKGYPEWFKVAKLNDTWRTAPVAYETCWDMRKWVNEGWPLRYIFNYALATHASYVNNKSAPLPEGDDVRPELERFLRRLGYRLIVTKVMVEQKGNELAIDSTWQNIGSAPCYRPFKVAWRLVGTTTREQVTETAVNNWMPGEVEVFTPEFIANPPDLPPGPEQRLVHLFSIKDMPADDYELQAAIVREDQKAAIRLGIAGRTDGGWYSLGSITVKPQ